MEPIRETEESKPTHGVGSARKALQMLLNFSPEAPRHTPAELAALLELPISSVYRYVSLFRELDLIEDAPEARLQLTPRILAVARAAMAVQDAVSVAAPYLHALMDEVGETVMLTRQAGRVAVVMLSLPSRHALRLDFPVGHTFALGAGATTKMLLALIPAVEQQRYISSLSAELQPSPEEIAETARRGWATSLQELEPGVWACAAGLSLEGQPPMTITVAGPLFRLTQQRRDLIVEKAARTATEVKADWTADIGSPSKAPRQEAG